MTNAVRAYKSPLIELQKGRKVSIVGFRSKGAVEHLEDHLLDAENLWCDVGCMAKVMFGRNTDSNRGAIRRSVRVIFHDLLSEGRFLAISYDSKNHGRIASVKIYQGLDPKEMEHALKQLERMHRRKQLTDELLQSAKALVQAN